MKEVTRYLEGCIVIGFICVVLLIGIFVGIVIIARNNDKEEDRVSEVADIRFAYCVGPTREEKPIKWFTTGKIYIVTGTHITDDQGYDWDIFYTNNKKPHIKKTLGYEFYVV